MRNLTSLRKSNSKTKNSFCFSFVWSKNSFHNHKEIWNRNARDNNMLYSFTKVFIVMLQAQLNTFHSVKLLRIIISVYSNQQYEMLRFAPSLTSKFCQEVSIFKPHFFFIFLNFLIHDFSCRKASSVIVYPQQKRLGRVKIKIKIPSHWWW